MKSKSSLNFLILIVVAGILVVLNYIASRPGFRNLRADLTEKNIYTLSDGTKRILAGLSADKPLTIRLYITRDNKLMPQWAQAYATTVQDLLIEFERLSNKKIKLDRIDPRPDTEDEDRAAADDIQGYTVNEQGDKAYFGLAVEGLQQKEVIASLNPNEEANLEYQVARAIAKVSKAKRSTVGVMCPMPIAAPTMNFPGMPQRQPPWVVINQLRQDYDIREVPMSTDKIDETINVLLVVHPFGISAQTEFAIDQYLLKGGKVIAFLDPQCLVAKAYDNPGQPGMSPTTSNSPMSDMPNLLRGWGVTYDQTRIVADMNYRTQAGRNRSVPTFLSVTGEGINRKEPVTLALEIVQMFGAGSFGITEKKGIVATKLIESTENSEHIDSTAAEEAQRTGLKSFNSDGRKKTLALRLSGKFESAFPDGPPPEKNALEGAPKLPGEAGGEDKKDAGAPADAKKESKPSSLKEGNGEGVVFLFSDVDMEYDMFALESDQSGRPLPIARNSNIPLLLNVVEMLSGGSDLIDVRSRGITKRPFTKMQEMKAAVEDDYRPRIEKLQQEQQKLAEQIVAAKTAGGQVSGGIIRLNPAEVKALSEKDLDYRKQLRSLRKEQNADKDRVETRLILANLFSVPLVLLAFGLALAIRRSSLRAAH